MRAPPDTAARLPDFRGARPRRQRLDPRRVVQFLVPAGSAPRARSHRALRHAGAESLHRPAVHQPRFRADRGRRGGAETDTLHTGRIVPVYERARSITPKMQRRLVADALLRLPPDLDDPLPAGIRRAPWVSGPQEGPRAGALPRAGTPLDASTPIERLRSAVSYSRSSSASRWACCCASANRKRSARRW